MGEYEHLVRERLGHAKNLDPVLNNSCCYITGCLKPTNVYNQQVLARIAPPDIGRVLTSKMECLLQVEESGHPYITVRHLKFWKNFIAATELLKKTPMATQQEKWHTLLEIFGEHQNAHLRCSILFHVCRKVLVTLEMFKPPPNKSWQVKSQYAERVAIPMPQTRDCTNHGTSVGLRAPGGTMHHVRSQHGYRSDISCAQHWENL